MANLKNKHFGNAVLLRDLNLKRFPMMKKDTNEEFKIPQSGILTRYEDGTVGVSIILTHREEGYGTWIQEATDQTTISAWAECHQ